MSQRKTEIEVFEGGDGQHIVAVTITEGAREIGKTQLPGGTLENATAIAIGLKSLVDQGVDLAAVMPDPPQIIGAEAVYQGCEARYGGRGAKVLITAIIRRDEPVDGEDRHVTDNARLAELGGLRPQDGAEVHVWVEEEKRWSFVGEEVRNIALLKIANALAKLSHEEE